MTALKKNRWRSILLLSEAMLPWRITMTQCHRISERFLIPEQIHEKETWDRIPPQRDAWQLMVELQAKNLSKNMRLKIHRFHQNPLMQKGPCDRNRIKASSIQVVSWMDHAASYKSSLVTYHWLHQHQNFVVQRGDSLAPSKYSSAQNSKANFQLGYEFWSELSHEFGSVENG